MTMAISIIALVLSLAALCYTVKLTLVYHRFNEQIKDWAQSLDDSMEQSIYIAARRMLQDIDKKVEELNNAQNQEEESNEQGTKQMDED